MCVWKRIVVGLCLGIAAGHCATGLTAELKDLVAANAAPEKIVGDCKFTEGPAYCPKGFLLFSDIPNSRIVRLDKDGSSRDFLKPSGKANGLAFDAAGSLYVCQGEARRVVKISPADLKVEALCESFDGKPLNSPNDLALDGHGGLYFTDPRYGADMTIDQPCMGVYYIDSKGKTTRVIDQLQRPNGILVSTDRKSLYVAEPNRRQIYKYEIKAPGDLGEGKPVFTSDEQLDGNGPDGMALDQHGNIYATYKGIVVLDAEGKLIGRIATPEQPANCKFGGPDGKTLYITARTSVYSLAMNVTGPTLFASGPRSALLSSRPKYFRGRVRLSQGTKETADDVTEITIQDVTLKVPKSWKREEPSNNLRAGQFKLPGEKDEDRTELVISTFAGGGGGVDQNFKRWNEQFVADDRKIKLTTGECDQGKYYVSDISGTYLQSSGGPFAGGKKTPKPGYRSMSVVLEVPKKGVYFLRLTGPEKSVTAGVDAFRKSFGGEAAKEKPYELK